MSWRQQPLECSNLPHGDNSLLLYQNRIVYYCIITEYNNKSIWRGISPGCLLTMGGINMVLESIIFNSYKHMQGPKLKEDDDQANSNSINSSQEDSDEGNQDELNSFVADDDQEIEYQEQEEKERRKKKKHGREKRKKRRRQDEVDEELWDDDLELLAENQREGFTKLKKKQPKQEGQEKREHHREEEEDDLVENEGVGYEEESEGQEQSDINDHYEKENNIEDIFEPGYDDFLLKNEDEIMIDHDVPERLLVKYKDRPEESDMREYLKEESQWIYEKLREQLDERKQDSKVKESIYKVLELLRIEYCEIMYIYYYKKCIWASDLSLDLLWKIYQLDDEWTIIKNMKKQLVEVIFPQLESLEAEIEPSVHRLLEDTTDIKTLRYIKEYADHQLLKKGKVTKKESKRSTLTKTIMEVSQHNDIISFIEKDRVWLTPAQFYENIREMNQKYKPKTPTLNPKDEIENFVKNRPYLNQSEIFLTIAAYLKQELFNFPKLRKWMKEKYSRRSVITTTPTKKGEEDIGLYSLYYPVKRIDKKPASSFKNDLWTLVMEAEKSNLIKVSIMYEWESNTNSKTIENDPIFKDMIQMYFDHSNRGHSIADFWNLLRKEILQDFIIESFTPFLRKEIKQDLTKQAEKYILAACGTKFKSELNKGPSLKGDGKSTVVMGMVLEGEKLGLAIVDEDGNLKFKGTLKIPMFANLNTVVTDKAITDPIEEFKPELIVVAANCRQALTLRKQLRETKGNARQERGEFCALGDYEICSKIAKYQTFKTGTNEERAVLEAIALCRLEQNAMAEILNLWSEKIDDNGCLMLNLHPLQKTLNKYKLKSELERVAIEMVNLVGLDLRKVKDNSHLQKQVQFICGLGYKKAIHFLEKLKIFQQKELKRRFQLHTDNIVGKVVYRNCSAFFKICTPAHQEFLQNGKLDKRQDKENPITLLDITRIHDENYSVVQEAAMVAVGDSGKKKMDYEQCIAEVMKNPSKFKTVQFDKDTIDMDFITQELNFPFRDPREPDTLIDNRDAFFSILRESPETLKKYMIFSAKIVNISPSFLNVKILDNGLFGSIRLPNDDKKVEYVKDSTIKAVITRFPFEPEEKKKNSSSHESKQDQELLKVDMALNFPHIGGFRPNHDCLKEECYKHIVKQIHPKIDMDHFIIKKQDIPVIEVREEVRSRVELRLFNHPKFKNMGITQAIEWISSEPIGEFIVRPSATKKDYLTITWKFYEGIVCHINVRAQPRTTTPHSYSFKIQQKDKERTYGSFDEMIDQYVKPMNRIMQDVISNRKFLPLKPEDVVEKLKQETQQNPSIIHYFFGCSVEFPKFVVLYYIPKENKLVKELIRVKDTGLLFHDRSYGSLKELTTEFKTNFTQKEYQRYVQKTLVEKLK